MFIAELSVANEVLRTVSYQSPLDRAGVDSVTISVDDLGNSGSGGHMVSSVTLSVTSIPVNDAPVIQAPSSVVASEDVDVVFLEVRCLCNAFARTRRRTHNLCPWYCNNMG